MQNKLFAAIMTALLVLLMAGSAMCATTYDSSVILENKDSDWNQITTDDFTATIEYNSVGEEFAWHAYGKVPLANEEYLLIYYADKVDRFKNWGGNNPGALIGTFTTDGSGNIPADAHGYKELDMDLPCSPDANIDVYDYSGAPDNYTNAHGAKLWMVPGSVLDKSIYPGDGAWTEWFWHVSCQPNIMFETDLITYEDCDEFYPGAPPVATFYIGDAFNGDTIPIVVLNATNAGSVDMTLTYNTSLVEITGISGGDMDAEFWNEGTGEVRIGAYQTNSPGIDGDFAIVYVTFASIGEGSCDFCEFGAFDITVTTYKDATPCGRSMLYDASTGVYCPCLNGDVNCDGDVDMFDVMYIAKYSVGITGFESICECAADVDGSGDIDIADAGYLARYILGFVAYDPLR